MKVYMIKECILSISLVLSLVRNFMCQVIYDRVTDRSRGFGFVTMSTVDEANQAVRMFDGSVSIFSYFN